MGFVVDEDDVAGLIEERHGPIGKGSSGGTDDLTGRRIDGYTVSFDESTDMKGTLMGKDGIGALGELIGLLKATDTNGKTVRIFTRREVERIILLQEVVAGIFLVVNDPNVLV